MYISESLENNEENQWFEQCFKAVYWQLCGVSASLEIPGAGTVCIKQRECTTASPRKGKGCKQAKCDDSSPWLW